MPLWLTDMEHTTVLRSELTQGPYCPDESAVESRVRENLTHGSERGRWKHDPAHLGAVRRRPTLQGPSRRVAERRRSPRLRPGPAERPASKPADKGLGRRLSKPAVRSITRSLPRRYIPLNAEDKGEPSLVPKGEGPWKWGRPGKRTHQEPPGVEDAECRESRVRNWRDPAGPGESHPEGVGAGHSTG